MEIQPFDIRVAEEKDIDIVFQFINELAKYEKLAHEVVATKEMIYENLFGEKAVANAIIAYNNTKAVGFALYFYNFSTFVGKKGIYLEDLFVLPEFRGQGYGKALLVKLAQIAVKEDCGRFEWTVLDWNTPSIKFYKSIGAKLMDNWIINRITGDGIKQLAEGKI